MKDIMNIWPSSRGGFYKHQRKLSISFPKALCTTFSVKASSLGWENEHIHTLSSSSGQKLNWKKNLKS